MLNSLISKQEEVEVVQVGSWHFKEVTTVWGKWELFPGNTKAVKTQAIVCLNIRLSEIAFSEWFIWYLVLRISKVGSNKDPHKHQLLYINFTKMWSSLTILLANTHVVTWVGLPPANYICPNCKMYFPELKNIFVQIDKLAGELTWSHTRRVCLSSSTKVTFVAHQVFAPITQVYLYQLHRYICPAHQIICTQWILPTTAH